MRPRLRWSATLRPVRYPHAAYSPASPLRRVVDNPLWTVTKDDQSATAVLRSIENVGVELRLFWDGIHQSRLYQTATAEAEALSDAMTRHRELLSRGWQ